MATTATGSGVAASPFDQQSTRDSYIPIFDGTPSGYKEWRKRLTIYAKKMELTNRKNEGVLNLLGRAFYADEDAAYDDEDGWGYMAEDNDMSYYEYDNSWEDDGYAYY
eukprot:s295_g18.t1